MLAVRKSLLLVFSAFNRYFILILTVYWAINYFKLSRSNQKMSKVVQEDKSSFHTISNSVNVTMQQKLYDEGRANYRYRVDENPGNIIGIEPTCTALAMAIVELCSAGAETS